MYNPTNADSYNFLTNLKRFFGVSDESSNVKQPWRLPGGGNRSFTEMSLQDIDKQSSREPDYFSENPSKISLHWKKLPFTYTSVDDADGYMTSQHGGYFIVPAYESRKSRNPEEAIQIKGVVTEDGQLHDYKTARDMFSQMASLGNKYRDFKIGEKVEDITVGEVFPDRVKQDAKQQLNALANNAFLGALRGLKKE